MFDLNIDHYSKNDVEELFNLKGRVYTNEEVEESMNTIKTQMNNEGDVDPVIKNATLNFLLTAKELLMDVQPDLITNQVLDEGNNFLIQKPKQKPSDVGYSDQPYYRGTLNPVQRRVNEVLVNIDSRFRDSENSLSTDFTISFPDLIKNVISMQVKCVEELSGFYTISAKLQNNYIGVDQGSPADVNILTIPDGIYTPETLVAELNTQYNTLTNKVPNFSFVLENGKLIFDNSSGGSDVSFHPMYYKTSTGAVNSVNDEESFQDLRLRLAWILGIRSLGGATLGDYVITSGETVTASTILQIPRVSYANLVVDDFQNNFYQSVINGANSYIQNSNIVARIGNVHSTKNTDLDSPERKYFGPVDIQRLKVQLVDEFGRIVDLNGNELSFSLLLKTQYDM
jgi:hypothetical protein